jgi:hypothetical protein
LEKLLANKRLKGHAATPAEIADLRAVVDRDLQDARLSGLSPDRGFATAYNAALQVAQMVVLCAGYRVAAVPGHHVTAFQATEATMGSSVSRLMAYFEVCRRKRNQVDYDGTGIATDTEAAELIVKAEEFLLLAENWIAGNHPQFKK